MHVIALEDQPSSLRGGQELNLFEICQNLAQRGHQISLLYGKAGNLLDRYQQFCDEVIKIDRYGFDRRQIGEVIEFLPMLAKISMLPVTPDSVIFSNSCHSIFWGALLALYRKLPLICYIQSPSMSFNWQKSFGLKRVDQFVAVSHYMRQQGIGLDESASKTIVVHNGTNLVKFKPAGDLSQLRAQWGIPEGTQVISYVGRLDQEKGVSHLIAAFRQLFDRHQNIKLLIAGKSLLSVNLAACQNWNETDSEYQQFLQRIVRELRIESQVQFLGHLDDPVSLYQVSDLTVVPSLWPEPFGRSIIESMACGTPVVASRTGGIPEILTGEFQKNLVDPGDVQQLADRMDELLNWRSIDPDLGKRCRDHVATQFSLEKMVNGIEEILMKVIPSQSNIAVTR